MSKKVSINYRIWEWLSHNQGEKQGAIVSHFGLNQTTVASALVKMIVRGSIERSGEKWQYTYIATDLPPQKYGRVMSDAALDCGRMVYVDSSAGNTIFDECRQNWPGYKLNKLLREVRSHDSLPRRPDNS